MERQLRAGMARSDFDGITSADRLAQTLAESLQALTHDNRLEVRYSETPIPAPAAGNEDAPDDEAAFLVERRRFNFGFKTVGRLKCDVGYIDLRQTHGGDPDSAMLERARCRAGRRPEDAAGDRGRSCVAAKDQVAAERT